MNILLVEDDPVVLAYHYQLLSDLGHQVTKATSGQEALAHALKGFDILFLDMGLPDIGGPDIVRSIRRHETAQHVPIVAVTTYNRPEDHAVFVAAGVNEVLGKPLNQDGFKECLQRYFPGA